MNVLAGLMPTALSSESLLIVISWFGFSSCVAMLALMRSVSPIRLGVWIAMPKRKALLGRKIAPNLTLKPHPLVW